MEYQQCRYKNQIEKIPVRKMNGQSYVLLDDVHDCFPGIQYFTCSGTPVPFEHDDNHTRLKPWRIRASIENIIDCHVPMYTDKVASTVDDDFKQELSAIHADLKKTLENTEILKKKADVILRQTFELEEYTVPRLFFVLPETSTGHFNPNEWLQLNYRLYFLCESEEDNGPHLAFHEGYLLKQPRQFLRQYGPYLQQTLPIINHAIPGSSSLFQNVLNNTGGISNAVIDQKQKSLPENLTSRFEQFTRILNRIEPADGKSNMRGDQYLEGPELREIKQFLKVVDPAHSYGNLYRSVTKEGHIRWICSYHHQKCYSDRKVIDLHGEFQDLGGEIRQDTAIISEHIGARFPSVFNLLRRGLRVCAVVLKNISIEEKDFHELLTYLSQQSSIYRVEIEEMTVIARPFNAKKRFIISKLDETVRANEKLTIQYSFTKLLSAIDSKVIETISKTNARLIVRLQSREDSSSIELVGNSKIGFSLTISSSDQKSDINSQTAIKNLFSFVPNIIKVSIYSGVIPKTVWTSFYQFCNSNQTLEEFHIDGRLTVEQLMEFFQSLERNKSLKVLDMSTAEIIGNDSKQNQNVSKTLTTYSFVTHAIASVSPKNELKIDFVVQCLHRNKSLRVVRLLPYCLIDRDTDMTVVEAFLRTTSIQTLGLPLRNTGSEELLERLAQAVDMNETMESIELYSSDSFASFHRIVSPQQQPKEPVPTEAFYSLCHYPTLYKELQGTSRNFELEELEVTVDSTVPMNTVSLSMQANLTVTRLRFDARLFTTNDLGLLGAALRANTQVTHLILNDIRLSITDLRHLFQFIQDDRTLRVLEIKNCIADSYFSLLLEQIKSLELKNPLIKIVYD